MTLMPGQILQNRYRIIKLLSQGGFGAVYRAWDMNMKVTCAVKENQNTSPDAQKQFEREAKLLFQLRHPNLPRVYDQFLIPGQGQYLVMDFVEGQDLADMVEKSGPISEGQALAWIGQVCDALGYMHNKKPPVIHRDIKPGNIIITRQSGHASRGNVILVDFGIAKTYSPLNKTSIGAQAVTPGYSPIEQYGQGGTDARSDVYSLGATLYTMLTGQFPPEATVRAVQDTLTPAIQNNVNLSARTAAVLVRALQVDQAKRYDDADAFKMDLLGNASPPSLPKPVSNAPRQFPKWWILTGLLAIILLTIGLILAWNTHKANEFASSMLWKKDGMMLWYVPAGPFLMGSKQDDAGADVDELPQRTVILDSFWIDQHEVTNAQYALCVIDGACQPPSNTGSYLRRDYFNDPQYADFPVIYVSWNDADSYCRWAERRLPTEAEWEKAARGQNGQIYPWGDQAPTCDLLNFKFDCVGDTTAAGSYPSGASPYSVLDMAGNVLEWVQDWYDSNYYQTGPTDNPPGPSSGSSRVLRGGAWGDNWYNVRTADRNYNDPSNRGNGISFRCARSP